MLLHDPKQVTMSLSLFIYKIRDFGPDEEKLLPILISVILLFYSLGWFFDNKFSLINLY